MNKFEYLNSRRHWDKLGNDVLIYIANAFKDTNDEEFIEFVDLSEQLHMLRDNFIQLHEIETDTSKLIWLISGTLHRARTKLVGLYYDTDKETHFSAAITCYNSSIILSKNFITGYFSLASAFGMTGDSDKAMQWFIDGANIYYRLKTSVSSLNSYEKAMIEGFEESYIEDLRNTISKLVNEK